MKGEGGEEREGGGLGVNKRASAQMVWEIVAWWPLWKRPVVRGMV